MYLPPKRLHLKPSDIRDVQETTSSGETTRRFCVDVVTRLVKNKPKPVQTYLDKCHKGTYAVRIGESYPLDKLVREAFGTVQHVWNGGGWLEHWAFKQWANGGDLRFDGSDAWYEYVPNEEAPASSSNDQKRPRTRSRKHQVRPTSSAPNTKKRGPTTHHVIRFTGFRDPHLAKQLEAKGHKVTSGNMTSRVTVVVWNGKAKSQSVREAEAHKGVALWRRDEALRRA